MRARRTSAACVLKLHSMGLGNLHRLFSGAGLPVRSLAGSTTTCMLYPGKKISCTIDARLHILRDAMLLLLKGDSLPRS